MSPSLHWAEQPGLGFRRRFKARELQGIRSSLARKPFDKHLIFYRADDALSIERIMHSARDLPRRLLEEPGAEQCPLSSLPPTASETWLL